MGAGGSRLRRISFAGGRVCGWNAHQGECQSEKHVQKQIPIAAKRYQEQLDEEIEADRSAHEKKPLKKDDDDDDPPKEKRVIESTTDPESGVFHKGERKKCFAYEAHTVCDKRGYVLETEVTAGNVHDSVAFDAVFQRLTRHYPEVRVVTADAGYPPLGSASKSSTVEEFRRCPISAR